MPFLNWLVDAHSGVGVMLNSVTELHTLSSNSSSLLELMHPSQPPTIDVGKKHILALYGTAKDGSPVDRLLRQTRGEDLASPQMLFRCSFWVLFADGLQRLIEGLLHRGVFQVELKSNLGDELNEIGQRVWPSHGSVRNREEKFLTKSLAIP